MTTNDARDLTGDELRLVQMNAEQYPLLTSRIVLRLIAQLERTQAALKDAEGGLTAAYLTGWHKRDDEVNAVKNELITLRDHQWVEWDNVAELTGCRKIHGNDGPAPTIAEMVKAFKEDVEDQLDVLREKLADRGR